ncbi:MAG: UDP-N-acetylmuramoyl-L-alanyl-D-glutamate--2,6-diaminopimelate ligase [Blastocatellia bacterium]|nr:UDP-N-acetylmuramoyl-L-alanyl-D-glutamate--2,6-diaminopimelate ligase [Blastocatellia bacterium]
MSGATGRLNLDRPVDAVSSIVTNDSRRAVPGGIFVAITGAQVDGNQFVDEATMRGAIAVVSEQDRPPDYAGVWMRVPDARIALAKIAALAHDHPSRKMNLVGVTGTNGKTTVAHLVESIFRAAGKKSAMMGTIQYRIGDLSIDADFTTPESVEIQDFLRRAAASGVTHAVMEVSSIALEFHRADELAFEVAAFTNLTQDHLDVHGTMEAYFAAKRRLFDGAIGRRPAHAVINLDDPRGGELKTLAGPTALTYAIDARADIRILEKNGARKFGLDGLRFTAHTPVGDLPIQSPLVGRAFAYNVLCAIGIGVALGFEPEVIVRGIRESNGAAGRFERVSASEDDVTVIVDYAHTPDALANVMRIVRDAQGRDSLGNAKGRLLTLMGCGGDRDRSKRPLMGEEAARASDWVIATSDNPRSEDPIRILNDIRVGLDRVGKHYEMIVDRREAIFRAVVNALPGDVVLLAGKGHETYQILAGGKVDFDDRKVAREALAERRLIKSRM